MPFVKMASCLRAPFYRSKHIAADTADGDNFSCYIFRAEITFEEVSISRAHFPAETALRKHAPAGMRVFTFLVNQKIF